MFKKSNILFYLFFVVMFSLPSCQKGLGDSESLDNGKLLVKHIMTKGRGDGKVYRVGLKGQHEAITALYRDAHRDEPLEPGFYVDDDFVVNSEKGLRAAEGEYKLFIVYPSDEESQVEYDGYSDKTGYKVTRIPVGSPLEDFVGNTEAPMPTTKSSSDEDVDFAFSGYVDVTLDGVYLKRKGELSTEYIYDASKMLLKQKRSRFIVTFSCGNEIPDGVTLKNISINNLINEGYYSPSNEDFYYDRNLESLESLQIYSPEDDGEYVETGSKAAQIGDYEHYIISMDYSEKNQYGEAKWPQPQLSIQIGEMDEPLVAPLGFNILPQNVYTINITVNAVSVDIDVQSSPWTEVSGGSTVEGQQSWSLTIQTEGWIVKDVIDGINQN